MKQMKQMKEALLLALMLCASLALQAQWANPGSNPWTGGDMQFRAGNPDFEFNCTSTTGYSGLQFLTNGADDGYLVYDHGNDVLGFSPFGQSLNSLIWSVYADGRNPSSTSNGFFNIGYLNDIHLTMDGNEIGAKNGSGGPSTLFLNTKGGNIDLLGFANSTGDLFVDGSGLFYDNSSNRVGIGTNAPDAKFHLFSGTSPNAGPTSGLVDGFIEDNGSAYLEFAGGTWSGITFNSNNESIYGGVLYNHSQDRIQIRTGDSDFRFTVLENGNVGVGTSLPAFDFQVIGDVDITGELTSASDARLKKNIQPITNAIATLQGLHPVHYDFRTDEFPDMKLSERHKMGLIAQEVEKILPELVSDAGTVTKADGSTIDVKSVNYVELVPVLIQSIKELQDQLDQKDQVLVKMQSEMASMRDAIQRIENGTATVKKK